MKMTEIKKRPIQYRDSESYPLVEAIFGKGNHFYIPQGRNILVLMYEPHEKTKGGIIMTDNMLDHIAVSTSAGLVLARGPYAYDEQRGFYQGAMCHVGDWIDFRKTDVDRKVVWLENKEKVFVGTIRDTDVLSVIPDIEKLFNQDAGAKHVENLKWVD